MFRVWALLLIVLEFNLAGSETNGHYISRDLRFQQSAPYASAVEVMQRFHLGTPGLYNIASERFQVVQPGTYSTNETWGLFVWVSPSDQPRLPGPWLQVLADRKMVVVAPHRSGNSRQVYDRFRLALDACFNARKAYRIDPKRTFVSGFSGGGRIASMLGVAYADAFAGCFAVCGANFYQDVPAGPGQDFPASYHPKDSVLARAKRESRIVLLTGEFDPNLLNTKCVYEGGFVRQKFSHATYLEVPGMGHALPGIDWLEKALDTMEPEGRRGKFEGQTGVKPEGNQRTAILP